MFLFCMLKVRLTKDKDSGKTLNIFLILSTKKNFSRAYLEPNTTPAAFLRIEQSI